MTELTAAQAAVLADVMADAAAIQESWRLKAWFVALMYALEAHADGAARPDPPDDVRKLALAMLDTQSGVQVERADVDTIAALLAPYAARLRVDGTDEGRALANVLMAAINRLNTACPPPEQASENELADEILLHERECVADPPIRGPWCLRCPCGSLEAFLCSKCSTVLRVWTRARCEHEEQACTHQFADWTDVDDTCAPG